MGRWTGLGTARGRLLLWQEGQFMNTRTRNGQLPTSRVGPDVHRSAIARRNEMGYAVDLDARWQLRTPTRSPRPARMAFFNRRECLKRKAASGMRQCHFCDRWFRSRQSVRAHLRFCPDYARAVADGTAVRHQRVPMYQCQRCKDEIDLPNAMTEEQRDKELSIYGGCGMCGGQDFVRVGWKRVPIDE